MTKYLFPFFYLLFENKKLFNKIICEKYYVSYLYKFVKLLFYDFERIL